jgi:hypothetical protein
VAVTHLTYQVWNPTNLTYLGTLESVVAGEFVDEYNSTGVGTVTVPLLSSDAALLTKDAVIRVIYRDEVRFAWFVETREHTLAPSGNDYTLKVTGRGLLGWLDDAVVFPQGGLSDFNSPDRPFNYASGPGSWRSSGNYTDALAVQWKNDTTGRKGLPVRWKDPSARWIWKTDPEVSVQRGTVNWFYHDFSLAQSHRVKFYASCDNQMEVWVDGSLAMSSSDFDQEAASFSQMARFTVRLGVGTHTIAARVKNDRPWTRYDAEVDADTDSITVPDHGLANGTHVTVVDKDGANGLVVGNDYHVRQKTDNDFKLATTNSDSTIINITSDGRIDLRLKIDNSAGFILTGLAIDNAGKELDEVKVRTTASWQVSSTEPYWRPALILRELIEEAAARGVYRLGAITFGYNATAPTSGSWSTEVDLTMQVGSPLGVVAADVVDLGHDLWLNPSTLELEAWESRGTDRSATVVFDTGVNLINYTTQVERPLKTVALVRSKDGWLRVADNTLRTANGWRETFLEYGSTRSEDVARRQAQKHLARSGKTQIAASGVEVAVITGAVPYVDFDVADVVSVPGAAGSGALGKARILSISLSESGGALRFVPELEVITSA